MSDDAISDIIQTHFTAEIEQLKLLRGNAKPTKGDRTRGKSTSVVEPDTLILNVMEQIAPLLIKTMAAVMGHQMSNMKQLLHMKDKRINALEERLDVLEAEADKREQYSRRPNLRFQGIPETESETTNELVLQTVNEKMGMQLTVAHLERSHRLGPKKDENGRPRKRAIIVRFRSEATRDEVFKARAQLKRHNSIDKDKAIFINEDLTTKRASLAYKTRLLKREKTIADCWTYSGRVLIKTINGVIKEVHETKDLDNL